MLMLKEFMGTQTQATYITLVQLHMSVLVLENQLRSK